MTASPAGPSTKRRWIVLAGAVALALVIGGVAFALTRPAQTAGGPTAPVTSGSPTAAPAPTLTPTATATESSASPTPSASKTQSPYCKAFARITAGGIDAGEEEGAIDFAALKKTFNELIDRYSAAADLAPASLSDDYAKVLAYLKQGRKAVSGQDLDELKTMVKNLSKLNDAMASIQDESQALCG
jgi:hypothetical protein